MSIPKIGILGAGSWGTALGILLAKNGSDVALWGHQAEHIATMSRTRTNEAYLPGVPLPDNLSPTTELEALADAHVILVVTPSRALREVSERLAHVTTGAGQVLVSCTKGIERGSGLRMSEVLAQLFPAAKVAALSGPSHAEEVGRGMPTAIVLACGDEMAAQEMQRMFNSPSFRTYTSGDVAGVELGGALKNIFALGAGVCDGLGLGDNSKAALITRSLAELIRLGTALGGRAETFQGLSGIGDLMVTCFSRHSRNRMVGERLGRGEALADITASMNMVAEGVPTTRSAYEQAQAAKLSTPIIGQIHRILYEGLSPKQAIRELMERDPKPENS
ncbi:MAG: NAD(P)H-dependent glycerol-3-phosphate dehydrogenase [Chthoniobacteraceae bacterium]